MRKELTIALFGEAEKGEFVIPQFYTSIPRLLEGVGHPPGSSLGIHFAIKALMHEQKLLFFRVKEEGFSMSDYSEGFWMIKKQPLTFELGAICAPGLGDGELVDEVASICRKRGSVLILSQQDLYDYLFSSPPRSTF